MSATRRRPLEALRRHLREDDIGKAAIGLTLAVLAVLATVVAGLETQASIESQRHQREADRIGLEAAGRSSTAVIQVGTAYAVYQRWYEEIVRANWASDQLTRNPNGPNTTLLETLRKADTDLQAWARSQSPLLQPPYFDPATNQSDFSKFQAAMEDGPNYDATYHREVEAQVANDWEAKANAYVTVLTILAVALFFLGLASTLGRRARVLLSVAGGVFGVVSLAWMAGIALTPVYQPSETAIGQLVASQTTYSETPFAPSGSALAQDVTDAYVKALTQGDAAIATDPAYTAAYEGRAEIRTSYGDAIFFSGSGPTDLSTQLLKGAMADYQHYLDAKPDDYAAWWNLGWAAYLVGDMPASIDATNRALELAPTQFTLYINRALARLASDDGRGANADMDTAIALAARDKSDSASFYLGESDFDLGRLAQIRVAEARPLLAMQLRLREAQVALAVRGRPVPASDAPPLDGVSVVPVSMGPLSGGTMTEGTPLSNGRHVDGAENVGVRIRLPADSALAGRTLSARLWIDGKPSAEYTTDRALDGSAQAIDLVSPYGRAGLSATPGAYHMELYVDGAQRFLLDWTVDAPPSEPQYQTGATDFLHAMAQQGLGCQAPTSQDGKTITICTALDANDTQYDLSVTADGQDRITYVVLQVTTSTGGSVDVEPVAHAYFEYVTNQLFPPDIAARAKPGSSSSTPR